MPGRAEKLRPGRTLFYEPFAHFFIFALRKELIFNLISMKKVLPLFLLLVLCMGSMVVGQNHAVDSNELVEETQQTSPDDDVFRLVWWIPYEFWEVALSEDPSITEDDMAMFEEILKDYNIVGVIDGEIGIVGNMKYRDFATIKRGLSIRTPEGKVMKPMAESEVSQDANALLEMMRPFISNMLGAMGENFYFYVFPANSSSGKRLLDPYSEGRFSIQLDEEKFNFRLPLGSLFPKKACPVDGEWLNGAWKYCPWHGSALKD